MQSTCHIDVPVYKNGRSCIHINEIFSIYTYIWTSGTIWLAQWFSMSLLRYRLSMQQRTYMYKQIHKRKQCASMKKAFCFLLHWVRCECKFYDCFKDSKFIVLVLKSRNRFNIIFFILRLCLSLLRLPGQIKTFASMYVMIWTPWCRCYVYIFFFSCFTHCFNQKDEISNVLLLDRGSETEVRSDCMYTQNLKTKSVLLQFCRLLGIIVFRLSLFIELWICVQMNIIHKTDPKEVKICRKKTHHLNNNQTKLKDDCEQNNNYKNVCNFFSPLF